jgi:hypothetical protein
MDVDSLFTYHDWRSMIQGRSMGLGSPGAPGHPPRIFDHQYLGGFLILGIAISLSINTDNFSGLYSVILAQE